MTELATTTNVDIVERVITAGDLSRLQPAERVQLYAQTCKSLGLNPLTRPFEYIQLNGKLTLYARKDATDQLRKIHGVSIGKPEIQQVDDLIIVTVVATDASGRTDSDLGVVKKSDMRGDVSNAMMKAVTKAKRRVTLSICGLGFLDESEVDTIPDAKPVVVAETGEIVKPELPKPSDFDIASKRLNDAVLDARSLYAQCKSTYPDLARGISALGEQVKNLSARKATLDEVNALAIQIEDTNAAARKTMNGDSQ